MTENQLIVLKEIERIGQFKCQQRYNITEDGKGNNRGVVLGYIRNLPHYYVNLGYPKYDISRTSKTNKYKQLYEDVFMLGLIEIPNFEFTSVQVNYNHKSCKHIDAFNFGESYIIALGDYSGGQLRIYNKDDTFFDVDIKNKWYKFNGSKFYHETLPFTGNRFSLVYYKLFQLHDLNKNIA